MRKTLIALVAAGLALALTGCSRASTDPDEVAVHYKGGAFTSKSFSDCIDPSTRQTDGWGDTHFYYPAGKRTYSFTGREGSELKPIQAKTSNQVNLSVAGFIDFRLKTDCKSLRKFHEELGRKYGAYSEDSGAYSSGQLPKGWSNLLNDYLATPLNTAVDNAGLAYDWKTLSYDDKAQSEFEQKVKDGLPSQLSGAIRDYIVIEGVSIQPPEPPADLVEKLKAAEGAKAENDAQKQKNATARTKYDTFRDCKKALSEQSCVLLELAEGGKVPLLPIPDGALIDLKEFAK